MQFLHLKISSFIKSTPVVTDINYVRNCFKIWSNLGEFFFGAAEIRTRVPKIRIWSAGFFPFMTPRVGRR